MIRYIDSQPELEAFFSEEYYNSINYTDYASRIIKYEKTATELSKYLEVDVNDSIFDYGCAIGLLLNGFSKLGFNNLTGFDISDWAVNNPVNASIKLSTDRSLIQKRYNVVTALDVFEHMFDEDLNKVLLELNTEHLVVRIPVKVLNESDFYLEVSRRDRSHVNCKTKGEWIDYIESYGYQFKSTLNLESIYDSKGCFSGHFIKA